MTCSAGPQLLPGLRFEKRNEPVTFSLLLTRPPRRITLFCEEGDVFTDANCQFPLRFCGLPLLERKVPAPQPVRVSVPMSKVREVSWRFMSLILGAGCLPAAPTSVGFGQSFGLPVLNLSAGEGFGRGGRAERFRAGERISTQET